MNIVLIFTGIETRSLRNSFTVDQITASDPEMVMFEVCHKKECADRVFAQIKQRAKSGNICIVFHSTCSSSLIVAREKDARKGLAGRNLTFYVDLEDNAHIPSCAKKFKNYSELKSQLSAAA